MTKYIFIFALLLLTCITMFRYEKLFPGTKASTPITMAQAYCGPDPSIIYCCVKVTSSDYDQACSGYDSMGNVCNGGVKTIDLFADPNGTDAIQQIYRPCKGFGPNGETNCGDVLVYTKISNFCCPEGQSQPHFVCNNGKCEQRNYCGTSTGSCTTNDQDCLCDAGNYKPHLECQNGVCTLVYTCGTNKCEQEHLSCGGGTGGCAGCSFPPTGAYCPYGIDYSCWPYNGCPSGFSPIYGYNCCCFWSPIIIDVNGDGFSFTSAEGGVLFDTGGVGIKSRVAWPSGGSDDAWLALDRNGNGRIDNGLELFGNFTIQQVSQERNGFLALAEFDKIINGGNNDGRIDNRDAVYLMLKLWQDINHNGVSEANEIHSLPSVGITGLDLNYKESKKTDQFGNEFKFRAKIYSTNNSHVSKWAYDVFPKLINQ